MQGRFMILHTLFLRRHIIAKKTVNRVITPQASFMT